MSRIELEEIEAARGVIDPAFLATPLVRSAELDAALGCALLLKDETRNVLGSFKGRGAECFAATALAGGEHLVCASAGNFGQGLAYAARRRAFRCTVFVGESASAVKVDAIRALGAELRFAGRDFDAAKSAARAFASANGVRFVEDGAEPSIAAGAGTIGLELCEQHGPIDALLTPVGNGALAAGVGAALRALAPRVRLIGIVAERAPAMKLSFERRTFVETETADTIADGIAVRTPVPESLPMLDDCIDAYIAVSERDIIRAMRLLRATLGRVVEPSAAVGFAAILAHPQRFRGQRVATILTGANVTEQQVEVWFRDDDAISRSTA